jgi:hypothetical protein
MRSNVTPRRALQFVDTDMDGGAATANREGLKYCWRHGDQSNRDHTPSVRRTKNTRLQYRHNPTEISCDLNHFRPRHCQLQPIGLFSEYLGLAEDIGRRHRHTRRYVSILMSPRLSASGDNAHPRL